MPDVAKHHRLLNFQNAHGKEEPWLAIDCAFLESGLQYARAHACKRILFGSVDNEKKAHKVGIEVLEHLPGLEGIMWQIPIPKGTDMAPLMAQSELKYLSIVQPKLGLDLAAFPQLEYFGFQFSEDITGYARASASLRKVRVSGLAGDLTFLGAVKGLVQLEIVRSDIESLAGLQAVAKLEELTLVLCRKLGDISQAASLKKLRSLSIDGSSGLTDLSAARHFDALQSLWLKAKAIESCGFIAGMASLTFASINAEIMDNDLSPLLQSKSLREVWFSPAKRSYVPKLSPDELNAMLAAR